MSSPFKDIGKALEKIEIKPNMTFTDLIADLHRLERQRDDYIRDLDRKVTELERITGYSLDELIDLYRSGRLIVYPESR